jgi:hypothetical protein
LSYPKILWDLWQAAERLPHAKARKPIYRYLDSVGDGTGWYNAITDNSGVSQPLLIAPPAGKGYRLFRIMPHIRDTGGFDADKYGNNVVLVNGIGLEAQVQGQAFTIHDRETIKTNAQWGQLAGVDVNHLDFGVGDESLLVRFTFAKAGNDLDLNGNLGDYLRIILNDNFSDLNAHTFHVQGYEYDIP